MAIVAQTVVISNITLERDQLEVLFHDLGKALEAYEGEGSPVLDHTVSVDLGRRLLEVEITVEATTEEAAAFLADRVILHAVSKTGGSVIDMGAIEDVSLIERELVRA